MHALTCNACMLIRDHDQFHWYSNLSTRIFIRMLYIIICTIYIVIATLQSGYIILYVAIATQISVPIYNLQCTFTFKIARKFK